VEEEEEEEEEKKKKTNNNNNNNNNNLKNVEPDRPQVTIWRMRIACWITNTTNTHSEYVILIALARQ
jgi:hypothetical protein